LPTIPPEKLDSRHKLVLYTVGQIENGVKTDVHLQKLLFLTINALDRDPEDFGYKPHKFGPDSEIVRVVNDELYQYKWINKYEDRGSKVRDEVRCDLNKVAPSRESDRFKIKQIASFVSRLSTDELLLFTYTQYPKYAENSEIKDRIFKKRKYLALKMVLEEKISIAKGAEISGMGIRDFQTELSKHG